jgi:outer membrane protein
LGDLVSLKADLQVKRDSLSAAQRLYQDTENQVEQGAQAPLQLTSASAQLQSSRQDYINSEGLVLQQELLLKELLTRRGISDPALANARIQTLTSIATPDSEALDPLPVLVNDAMENRPDVAVADLQLKNTHITLEGSRNELLPQLNLVASMQNNGLAGSPNSSAAPTTTAAAPAFIGGYGTAEEQIFSRDYPSYSVGVQLNLPLRNRVARADYARDELQLRQTEVRIDQLDSQIRLQVGNAQIAVLQAKSSYEAAVAARKLQDQALDVERARFEEGVDTAYTLIQYQRDLAQAQSAEVAALGIYAKAKAALERAVGLTLKNNNVDFEESYQGHLSNPSSTLPEH